MKVVGMSHQREGSSHNMSRPYRISLQLLDLRQQNMESTSVSVTMTKSVLTLQHHQLIKTFQMILALLKIPSVLKIADLLISRQPFEVHSGRNGSTTQKESISLLIGNHLMLSKYAKMKKKSEMAIFSSFTDYRT